MQATGRNKKLLSTNLTYNCPRCGDTIECSTEEDIFDAGTHRLLHIAGAWKRSLPAASRLLTALETA
jgi:hypothetical protein